MTGKEQKNLVFDTSALLKYSNKEKGHERVSGLFSRISKGDAQGIVSVLSAFEIISKVGSVNKREAVKFVVYLDKFCSFSETTLKTAKAAALLKLKYKELNLSTVDSIIIQTGIQIDAEIITSDKEWSKIEGVNVTLV